MSVLDLSKASMSHIRHYRVVPWATGPLTLLESIAKVPDRQVTKSWPTFYLLLLRPEVIRAIVPIQAFSNPGDQIR